MCGQIGIVYVHVLQKLIHRMSSLLGRPRVKNHSARALERHQSGRSRRPRLRRSQMLEGTAEREQRPRKTICQGQQSTVVAEADPPGSAYDKASYSEWP